MELMHKVQILNKETRKVNFHRPFDNLEDAQKEVLALLARHPASHWETHIVIHITPEAQIHN